MNLDEVDWIAVSRRAISKYWSFIAVFSLVGALFAAIFLSVSTPDYLIRTVLTSSDNSSDIGQFANLGSALGLNMSGSARGYFPEFLTTLTSVDVAEKLVAQGWLQKLYPSLWDSNRQRWRSSTTRVPFKRAILKFFGREPPSHPTAYDLHRFLAGNFKEIPVSSGGNSTAMTEIAFYYKNANLGIALMYAAIHDADEIIKDRATVRAKETRAYLESQLSDTNPADYQCKACSNK